MPEKPKPVIDYASPPKTKPRLHALTRFLVGIMAAVFVVPTINIVTGHDADGPVSKAIGIVVTLLIAFALGYISFTGRVKIRRD